MIQSVRPFYIASSIIIFPTLSYIFLTIPFLWSGNISPTPNPPTVPGLETILELTTPT